MKRTVAGKDELVLTGVELIEKLAILIPPPRSHVVRFHGAFAPNCELRPLVLPRRPAPRVPDSDDERILPLPRAPADATYRLQWAACS